MSTVRIVGFSFLCLVEPSPAEPGNEQEPEFSAGDGIKLIVLNFPSVNSIQSSDNVYIVALLTTPCLLLNGSHAPFQYYICYSKQYYHVKPLP